MKEILLHHCCAPCSFAVTRLLEEMFRVQSFWYNPNIHPADEHGKRKDSLARFVAESGGSLLEGPEESVESWIERWQASGLDRCRFCYALRLQEAARSAKQLGFGSFSTTLLASPYQKHELIREAGLRAANDAGIQFVYRNFRPFYYEGKDEARRRGAYMQKYCGCIFSRKEREEEQERKNKGERAR